MLFVITEFTNTPLLWRNTPFTTPNLLILRIYTPFTTPNFYTPSEFILRLLLRNNTPFTTPNLLILRYCGVILRYCGVWCSKAKCRPGATIKVLPFQPLKFAYNILNETKIMFHAYLKI